MRRRGDLEGESDEETRVGGAGGESVCLSTWGGGECPTSTGDVGGVDG